MMASEIYDIATSLGIDTPQKLSYEARITAPTARKIWEGDLSSTQADTLRKVAEALDCNIDDLYVYKAN
jgi:DNA-binding Xre family transcriptional regulator